MATVRWYKGLGEEESYVQSITIPRVFRNGYFCTRITTLGMCRRFWDGDFCFSISRRTARNPTTFQAKQDFDQNL